MILKGFPPSNTLSPTTRLTEEECKALRKEMYDMGLISDGFHIVQEIVPIEPYVIQKIKEWEEEQEWKKSTPVRYNKLALMTPAEREKLIEMIRRS